MTASERGRIPLTMTSWNRTGKTDDEGLAAFKATTKPVYDSGAARLASRGSPDGVDYGTRGSHGDEGKDLRDELAARSMHVTAAHFMALDTQTATQMKNMLKEKSGVEF